jgi:hypothetical protein
MGFMRLPLPSTRFYTQGITFAAKDLHVGDGIAHLAWTAPKQAVGPLTKPQERAEALFDV